MLRWEDSPLFRPSYIYLHPLQDTIPELLPFRTLTGAEFCLELSPGIPSDPPEDIFNLSYLNPCLS